MRPSFLRAPFFLQVDIDVYTFVLKLFFARAEWRSLRLADLLT
jgi:hypothetical protein